MKINKIKQLMLTLEMEELSGNADEIPDEVEIYADSVQEGLRIASNTLLVSISDLDYEIKTKGSNGIMGVGRTPYRMIVRKATTVHSEWDDLDDMDVSLDTKVRYNEYGEEIEADIDGRSYVRIYSNGVFLFIEPPSGNGNPVSMERVVDQIHRSGYIDFDRRGIEKAINKGVKTSIKIANFVPKPGADSKMTIDIAPDEMTATIIVSAPRPGGRHLTAKEVVHALKKSGVVYGFAEEDIDKSLSNDTYGVPIVAARGEPPENGNDGYIDYKVRIDKKIEFKEDESGRVDFHSKDLIENVVQGQVLAELVPPGKGKPGRTLFNKIIPATDGHPTELKPGKGTILSDDGKQVIAEKNGQVVFIGGKVNVEETYVINGDVGLDTGNIMFLGSVMVRGSISDNMEVKAAGNIEVAGAVQKAHIEAEGDVIVRQGIMGRDGAVIESTTGSVIAKFVQNTFLNVEKDVIVGEGILHSKIHAGGKIICNGKRAQIVGGEIMVGEEIRVKQLGAQAATPTTVNAGTNPKILQQIKQLENIHSQAKEKLDKIEQNIRTLTVQKSTQGEEFNEAKSDMLNKMIAAREKIVERLGEADAEKLQLQEYLEMLAGKGKVHVEKTLFPGVKIIINNAEFVVNDEYNHVTLVEENGNIKILPYEEEGAGKKKKKGGKK